jgi:hypothetical protein
MTGDVDGHLTRDDRRTASFLPGNGSARTVGFIEGISGVLSELGNRKLLTAFGYGLAARFIDRIGRPHAMPLAMRSSLILYQPT